MDVPNHLLNPPAGGWPIHQAAGLWAWLCYAIPPTAPDTTEVGRIRNQAFREIRAIATPAPAAVPARPIRRQSAPFLGPEYDEWLIGGPTPPRGTPKAPSAAWVTRAALEALCARRGVPFGSSPPRAAGAPVAAVAGPDKTRDKPGKVALQDAAALVNELVRNGTHTTYDAAAWEAEGRFKEYRLKQGTILREARRLREI